MQWRRKWHATLETWPLLDKQTEIGFVMSKFRSVVAELEFALRSGSPGKRTEALLRVTDVFSSEAETLSEHQLTAFDDVLDYLVGHLEQKALAELSQRLAPNKHSPRRIVQKLGSSDSIEVAGPILTSSLLLTDQDLVEIAKTKGQAHQLRIAGRPQLGEAVTEALIDRGDSEVVQTVAGNKGARFSETGFTKLAALADGDDRLSSIVASRSDVPPRVFREILTRASQAVRQRLLATARPENRETLKKVLSEISGDLGTGQTERHYAKAQKLVSSFSQDTQLTKWNLVKFARQRKTDEVVATLAALTAIQIELIDRIFYGSEPRGLMTLCKLFALEWNSVREVLLASPSAGKLEKLEAGALETDYQAITPQLAQRIIRFWESRARISAPVSAHAGPSHHQRENLIAMAV
jgi:uncharacterized protein (DUF2336 family)